MARKRGKVWEEIKGGQKEMEGMGRDGRYGKRLKVARKRWKVLGRD